MGRGETRLWDGGEGREEGKICDTKVRKEHPGPPAPLLRRRGAGRAGAGEPPPAATIGTAGGSADHADPSPAPHAADGTEGQGSLLTRPDAQAVRYEQSAPGSAQPGRECGKVCVCVEVVNQFKIKYIPGFTSAQERQRRGERRSHGAHGRSLHGRGTEGRCAPAESGPHPQPGSDGCLMGNNNAVGRPVVFRAAFS